MPFGLCNAPSTFQRLMNKVFTKEINSFTLVYLDDISVYSRSVEEHWDHLRQALEKLRRAKLYGRLHKCEVLKDKVDYLGFEVSADGAHASPEKVKAILDWPRLEMCAGQNLLEQKRKKTRSRLKKIFLFLVFFRFFSFLGRVFPLFPIFLWISHPVFRHSFPGFSSFHLSKPVPYF